MFLGLDLSTQGLTGVVIDPRERRVVWRHSLEFDAALPQYGTRHGVLPSDDPLVATSSPLMWAEALDLLMATLAADLKGHLRSIGGISGCAQQHGSVYLNASARTVLPYLDPRGPLADQLRGTFTRPDAPIWMDASTATECAAIAAAVGGETALQRLTGSRSFLRFTGPQIARFQRTNPAAYAATDRIHLVSSFLASLLVGTHAPLEPGDASGMHLMDIRAKVWSDVCVTATAPGLSAKLPAIVPPSSVVGRLSRYWTERYGLPSVPVIAWTGDNPSSTIGVGLTEPGDVAISLGTSDTLFGLLGEPRVDPTGAGHVFGAPTGAWMGLVGFRNGSLARERVRDAYGLDWSGFSRALSESPPGNGGAILVPWFDAEITPRVMSPGVRRYGLDERDRNANVRAVVEAQAMAMALHASWMGERVTTIRATGGASGNREILQVIADAHNAEVCQLAEAESAALGAALRAWHGTELHDGRAMPWREVVAGFTDPVGRVPPIARNVVIYADLKQTYAACEAQALATP